MEHKGYGISVRIRASGAILSPWYTLPPQIIGMGEERPIEIAPPRRVEMPEHGIRLLFQSDEVTFVFTRDGDGPRYLVEPLRYFLIYQTYIHYNIIYPAFPERGGVDLEEAKDSIRFKVQRIVPSEKEEEREGKKVRYRDYDYEECWIELPLERLSRFLAATPTLCNAIAYYLRGVENRQYFLVEFYKALEVIENELGGERGLLTELGPHGVVRTQYKEFKRTCNDMQRAVDIGRHAPEPGAAVHQVNLRYLFEDGRSRELFESATMTCRQVIDAYFEWVSRPASATASGG
jgi:hypothetical protein